MMSASGQTLVTFNVRGGMNDHEKRLSISCWISKQRCAVAVLTECHGNAASLPYYQSQFSNSVWCLRDTDVHGGVGIVCDRSARIVSNHCFVPRLYDSECSGRALLAKVEINFAAICIVGTYAPAQARERVGFLMLLASGFPFSKSS